LSFEKGHVLTEEDIALLNRYLAQADHEMLVSSDDAINTGVKTSAKIDTSGKKGTFNATTEESVGAKTYQASEFKLKKSRLPFARSLKIAFKSLKSKPFRLVVTSILIITSLTMFGISATMAGYSPKVAFEGVYQNYEVSAVGLYREKYVKSGTNPDQYSRMAAGFSLKDIPDLNTETGLSFAVFPKLDKLLGYNQNGSITVGNVYHLSAAQTSDKVFDNYCSMAYYPSNESYFEIDAASLKDVYHSSLTFGRMPTSTSEVLISDYRYEAYQKFGYQFDSTPTETTKLSVDDCATPASFLAKSPQIAIEKESWDGTTSTKALKTYPIVGIVHTDFNFTPYQSLKNEVIDSNESYALVRQFKSALLESHGNAIFSLSGFYQNLAGITGFNFTNETPAFSLVVSPLGQDLASIDRWFDFLDKNHLLSYDNHPQVGYIYTVEDWANPDKIPEHSSFFSAYSNFCSFNSMITSMKKVFFWVGFATACFASLLLATFIASSIAYQKRQIGILRAIGARGGDVYGIFLNESLLITLTCALVAEILTGVLDGVLSRSFSGAISFNLPLLQFSIWVFLLVLALAVLTAAIASFLPCLIISKKKPIDSINDK
jgi:ABC-type antimicrobial peptide transport system permease subunit